MSSKHTYQVWAASQAKGSHKLVLLALADHADHTGEASVPLRTLSALCGLSESRVREIIDALTQTPELRVMRGGQGAGNANRYWITPPADRDLCVGEKCEDVTTRKVAEIPEQVRVDIEAVVRDNPPGPVAMFPTTEVAARKDSDGTLRIRYIPQAAQVTDERGQAAILPRQTIASDDVFAVLKAAKAKMPEDQPFFWTRREHRDDLFAILKRQGCTLEALCERIEKAVSQGRGIDFTPTRLTQLEALYSDGRRGQ